MYHGNAGAIKGYDLKDTLTCLRNEAQHLSPLFGAALSASPFIDRVYHFGISTHATTLLVRELFFAHPCATSLNEVRPTNNRSRPAKFLTPERLGKFVAHLELGYLTDKTKVDQLIAPICRESRCSKTCLLKLVNLILEAKGEEAIYFSHSTVSILLSFLWMIAKEKEDLLNFLLEVNKNRDPLQPSIFNDRQMAASSGECQRAWLDSRFCAEELFQVVQLDRSIFQTGLALEKIIATEFEISELQLQPYIRFQVYAYKGAARKPDCMEATIRNILNAILYDHSTNSYNLQQLNILGPVDKQLLAFYARYPGTSDNVSHTSGQEWMDLMSDRPPPVKYWSLHGPYHYELAPSCRNILYMFEELFGKLDPSTEDLPENLLWPKWGERLSTPHCLVQFEPQDKKVLMKVTRQGQGAPLIYSIVVTSNHAKLHYPEALQVKSRIHGIYNCWKDVLPVPMPVLTYLTALTQCPGNPPNKDLKFLYLLCQSPQLSNLGACLQACFQS